jgi:hypothetical protein
MRFFRIQPTRCIVPVWALEEIIAEYGTATEENYFKWLARRRAAPASGWLS